MRISLLFFVIFRRGWAEPPTGYDGRPAGPTVPQPVLPTGQDGEETNQHGNQQELVVLQVGIHAGCQVYFTRIQVFHGDWQLEQLPGQRRGFQTRCVASAQPVVVHVDLVTLASSEHAVGS